MINQKPIFEFRQTLGYPFTTEILKGENLLVTINDLPIDVAYTYQWTMRADVAYVNGVKDYSSGTIIQTQSGVVTNGSNTITIVAPIPLATSDFNIGKVFSFDFQIKDPANVNSVAVQAVMLVAQTSSNPNSGALLDPGFTPGQVKVDATDTTYGFLGGKLIPGANIVITPSASGNKSLTISTSVAGNAWNKGGNTATTPATDYLGTADATDFYINTNAVNAIRVKSSGFVAIGAFNPDEKLQVDGNIKAGIPGVRSGAFILSNNAVNDTTKLSMDSGGIVNLQRFATDNTYTLLNIVAPTGTSTNNIKEVTITKSLSATQASVDDTLQDYAQNNTIPNKTSAWLQRQFYNVNRPALPFAQEYAKKDVTTGAIIELNTTILVDPASFFVGIGKKFSYNDFTGLTTGTYQFTKSKKLPTTLLHVDTGAANQSGLRLEQLTTASTATTGAKAIGVDATGNAVIADLSGYQSILSSSSSQTSSFSASANTYYPVNATASAITATLPASTAGQQIVIKKTDTSVNIVMLSGNINGNAGANIPLRTADQGKILIADGAGGWNIIAGDLSIASLDARYQASLGFIAENSVNKSATLASPDDTKYPTTLATVTAISTKLSKAGDTITGDIANTTTGFFQVAQGTTAQRPASPVVGMRRYNSTTLRDESYAAGTWQNHARLAGDNFTGAISATNLSGTNTGDETNASIVSKLGYTPENTANKVTNFTIINDVLIPTVKAVNDLVTTVSANLFNDRGNFDASSNVFPSTGGTGSAGAIKKGNIWQISVSGTLGGQAVTPGDLVRALIDAPGQISTNWNISETNFGYVAENSANKATSLASPSNTTYPTTQASVTGDAAVQAFAIQRVNHTGTQAPATIVQDSANRFTTDAEKASWNAKADINSPTLVTPNIGVATANSLTFVGNITQAAWTTSGLRIKGIPATFTDTTSNGTVVAAYTDALGGNTIAASNATTFTNYITTFFREPVAGTNVTFTSKYALGAESLRIGTSNQLTVSTAGILTATNPIFVTPTLGLATANSLTLAGNISQPAWTTSGLRIKGIAAILTDTTSTGVVLAAYTDSFGGNTIAASNATTFTNYTTAFFKEPIPGTNVTFTTKTALGAESLRVGNTNPLTVTTTGILTAVSPVFSGVITNASPATQVKFTGTTSGNDAQGNPVTNTSPRVDLYTSQISNYNSADAVDLGGFSEMIRLGALASKAKPTIAWYDTANKPVSWIVAHYEPQDLLYYANLAAFPAVGFDDGLRAYKALDTGLYYTWSGSAYILLLANNDQFYYRAIHKHFSIETADTTTYSNFTRFAIPYGLDVTPITTSSAHFRIVAGVKNGKDYGAFMLDKGNTYSYNPLTFYPSSTNANTVESWKDSASDNIFVNNTKGFRIDKLPIGGNNLAAEEVISLTGTTAINYIQIDKNVNIGGGRLFGIGILAGYALDVKSLDATVTAGEHTSMRYTQNATQFMQFGYRADGTNLISFLFRATGSKNITLGTTGNNEAITILGSDGSVGINTNTPNTKLHVKSGTANDSGLRLENLTSSSPSTTGQPIGVDATGKVITVTPVAAGSDKQIQFNNAGVTAGSANLTWDNTLNQLVANSLGAKTAGTATMFMDRGTTANFGLMVWRTNAVDQWSTGLRNGGATGWYLTDAVNGVTNIFAKMGTTPAVGFGGNITPSAYIHPGAGTATAGTAPIKLTTGTLLTTAEDGAIEYNSSIFYATYGTTRDPVVLAAQTQTISNKRVTKRVNTLIVSTATYTPVGDTTDIAVILSPTAAYTIVNPTGTPTDGQRLQIRIKSGATAFAITWGAIYRGSTANPLSTSIPANLTAYFGLQYNATDSKWDTLFTDTTGH